MTTVPALSDEAALNQYVATGGQTDFNFSFMIFATADIEVYVNGVLKTEVTDYTVKKSGGGSISSSDLPLDGGKVVFGSGLTVNDEVTLNRNIAIARSTGYSVAGAFRADVVNREFTKQLAITQQLRRDIERSIRLATFDSEGGDLTLPTGRASKLIGFDADSNVALFGGVVEQEVPVSSFMVTLLDDADASAALTTLGISAFIQTLLNDADASAAQVTLGFPTLANTDKGKYLRVKTTYDGYDAVHGNVVSKTSTYTATEVDEVILCSGAAFTVNLPAAASVPYKKYIIKKTDSSLTNIITIDPNGSETIDGSTTTTLNTLSETLEIISDGSNWQVIRRTIPSIWTSFTPTGGWSSNTTYTGRWRRVGDSMEVQWYIALAGAPNSATLSLNLPSNVTIDTAKLPGGASTSPWMPQGVCGAEDTGSNLFSGGGVTYNSSTSVVPRCAYITSHSGTVSIKGDGAITQAFPFTFGNTDTAFASVCVPITGWN